MLEAAEHIFEQARTDGWRVDAPGFVYTTDFDGKPVVHERMHWVVCEGISASAAIREASPARRRTRRRSTSSTSFYCYRAWIDYAEEFSSPGVWTLRARPPASTRTWARHPDIALQATLMAPAGMAGDQAGPGRGRLDSRTPCCRRASKPHRRGSSGRS